MRRGIYKHGYYSQVWALYFLECPYHTQHVAHNDVFNWTATYRSDSDIVTPYEKWVYYDERYKQMPLDKMRNYAANKTHKVCKKTTLEYGRNHKRETLRLNHKSIGDLPKSKFSYSIFGSRFLEFFDFWNFSPPWH